MTRAQKCCKSGSNLPLPFLNFNKGKSKWKLLLTLGFTVLKECGVKRAFGLFQNKLFKQEQLTRQALSIIWVVAVGMPQQ
jgi:hypothetical protein